jgi:hypothetical protein
MAMAEDPFHSIESAQEYLRLLAAEVEVVRTEVSAYHDDATREQAARRLDALHVVDYKLKQLSHHLHTSVRILNDLKMLRRLLIADGSQSP